MELDQLEQIAKWCRTVMKEKACSGFVTPTHYFQTCTNNYFDNGDKLYMMAFNYNICIVIGVGYTYICGTNDMKSLFPKEMP